MIGISISSDSNFNSNYYVIEILKGRNLRSESRKNDLINDRNLNSKKIPMSNPASSIAWGEKGVMAWVSDFPLSVLYK